MYLDEYNRFKQENRLADFEDVIENAQRESFTEHIRGFDLLIIDEAQDLSDLQWRFVNRLISKARRVIVAGDDDQAIMVPFGASPTAFLEFNGTPIVLRQSWRVPRVAYEYVMKHTMPLLKQMFSERLEKEWLPATESGLVQTVVEKMVRQKSETPGGPDVSAIVSAPLKLQDLLDKVNTSRNEQWLIMAPTKGTCEKVSNGLRALGVPHFLRNRPILDGDKTASAVRVMSIHTSKGDEADNAALVVSSRADTQMLLNDPRMRYVAQTRAKKVLYPCVGR
jgi:DNA helicase IV